MASRPIVKYPIIVNGDMSADIISKPSIITNLSLMSYDISWVGSSPVGVMSIQVSNTYAENVDGTVQNAGSWTTVALSSPPSVSGNTGNGFIDVSQLGAYAVRIVYTSTSGTGMMNVVFNAKAE
jgi:hypothetical protein